MGVKQKSRITLLQKKIGCWFILVKVFGVLVLGYFTFFYPLMQYDQTLVEWHKPVFAGSIAGLIVAAIFVKRLRDFFTWVFVTAFAFNSVVFFMNDTFSDGKMLEFKFTIKNKSLRYGKSGPHAEIAYHDVNQTVNAASDEELKAASFAVLIVDKGLFGYYIMRKARLVK